MIYLKEFESVEAYNTFAASEEFVEPNVSMIGEYGQPGFGVKYNKDKPTPSHDYSQDYLTFEFLGNGKFVSYTEDLNYSLDEGLTWNKYSDEISVNNGDKILIKADVKNTSTYSEGLFNIVDSPFNLYGNVMSIYNSSNFRTLTSFSDNSHNLGNLFAKLTGLTSAENLILPATTLTENCYGAMFQGCTSLTTAPELPATTLANYCYNQMFYNCTLLTTTPELPATTLANKCYQYMFQGCTSLTTAPELPATTLAEGCYEGMFYDCNSLNYIKCLATDISAIYCIDEWVNGVAHTGTFVKNPNMSSWTTGDSGIPTDWTVQDAS